MSHLKNAIRIFLDNPHDLDMQRVVNRAICLPAVMDMYSDLEKENAELRRLLTYEKEMHEISFKLSADYQSAYEQVKGDTFLSIKAAFWAGFEISHCLGGTDIQARWNEYKKLRGL